MAATPARTRGMTPSYPATATESVAHIRLFAIEGLLLVLLALLGVAAHVVRGPLPGDVGVTDAVQLLLPQKQVAGALDAFSTIGWPQFAAPLLVVALVILFVLHRRLAAACLLGLVACADGTNLLLNDIVHRPRPSGWGIHVLRVIKNYYSFPSGHVEHFTAFCCFLIFVTLLARRTTPWLVLLRVVLGLTVVVMGISRILEGEHWPTDVVGGYLLGAFWVVVATHVYRWLRRRWPEGGRVAARGEA